MGVKPGKPVAISASDLGVEKRLKFIKEKVLIKDYSILDIGCGYGVYASALRNSSKLLVGIDINRDYLQKAKINSKNANFVLMDAETLAFKPNSFDLILMIEVLEHINNDEKALREAFRVTKPGGIIVLTVPNKFFPFETHAIKIGTKVFGLPFGIPLLPWLPQKIRKLFETARVYTPNKIKKKLLKIGFSKIEYRFLVPTLDRLSDTKPRLANIIRSFFSVLEKIRFSAPFFCSTLILYGEKNDTDT